MQLNIQYISLAEESVCEKLLSTDKVFLPVDPGLPQHHQPEHWNCYKCQFKPSSNKTLQGQIVYRSGMTKIKIKRFHPWRKEGMNEVP